MRSDFGTMEDIRKEVVLEVGFSARLRSVAERAYFQTGLFPRGCRLMEDLELGSGQMWEKGRIAACQPRRGSCPPP